MLRVLVCVVAVLLPSGLLASPSQSLQPAQLHGRVLDASGAPVASAQVKVRAEAGGPVAIVLADGRGEFALPLAPGRYTVTIGADGFLESSVGVTVSPAQERLLDVTLAVAGFSETVNVDAAAGRVTSIRSATKTSTPLRDVPQAVSVVTGAMMADQRMTNMADVVRFMPGVGMAQGEGNRDTPILRGNSSTSDFFVDGIRDDVQYFRDVYNLERVEALKGPNAMIFGRGGAGGVINRVTRQAGWGQSREAVLQLGSWDNRRLTADVGTGLSDTIAARLTGLYERSDSYRAGVEQERVGVQPSVAFRLGPATTLRASYEYFHDERTADRGVPSFGDRPVATGPETFFGDPVNSPMHATVNVLSSVIDHDVNDRVSVRNRVSYGVYDKFYQNVFPGAVNAVGTSVAISAYNNATDRDNLFNQTDVTVKARTGAIGHTVLVGAELGRQVTDNFRNTGYFPTFGGVTSVQVPLDAPTVSLPVSFAQSATDADNHGTATIAAIYAQDQVALTSRLQAVAGLRFDAFDLDFTNNRTGQALASHDRLLSPRLGLIYKLLEPVSVYGSYSLTYIPRGGDQLSSLSLTNQSLDPEEFKNYEVGMKWEAARLGVTAAVYRLDRSNVAVPHPADPTRSILVDAQRSKGLEVDVNGSLTRNWSLVAGYAYQDGEITRALSSTVPAGSDLAQVPSHSVSLWTRYNVTPRLAGALGTIARSRMFAATDNLVALPGFGRVDGAVFFNVTPKLRAQVNVENVFDVDYFSTAHSNNNITPGSPRAFRFALTAGF